MSSLNKATIIGRLGQDPEINYTKSNTAVANLSIATSDKYKDKQSGEWKESTEWHKVTAWGRTAEICQEYLAKGSLVYIEGPIKTRKWETDEGETRYSTEITALQLTMLGGKGKEGTNRSEKPNSSGPGTGNSADVAEDIDDSSLPF